MILLDVIVHVIVQVPVLSRIEIFEVEMMGKYFIHKPEKPWSLSILHTFF